MTKTLEREMSIMCNLSKGVEERGIQKGLTTAMLSSIKNIMDSMNLSAEQAINALKIPESERAEYLEKLNMD
jgi:hypothetical protein